MIHRQVTTELPRPEVAGPAGPSLPGGPPLQPVSPRGGRAARARRVRRGRAVVLVLAFALLALGFGWLAARRRGSARESSAEPVRTAKIERRDFIRSLRVHGTVEAVQSYAVAVPMLAGGEMTSLVITKLAAAGTRVKQGDLLVEFDRQKQLKNSLDKQAEYRDFEDQIDKKRADQASARAKDETELKQAEGALETARLEMRKNEVVSSIDAEKNKENLAEAEARLKQLRETFDLKRRAAEAEIRGLEIQRDRARTVMQYAQQNAEKMAIHAPIDGLVVLNRIWKGGRMDEPQEGDQIEPGVPFLQVVDPRAMQVRAKVNQVDVPYLQVGQPVRVRLDAYPELVFTGKLVQMAAIGVTSGLSEKVHTFATLFSIEGTDPKLLPDLSAAVDVELERIPHVLVAPRDAVFEKGGQAYVRVKTGSGFDERLVKTGPTDEVDVVIDSGVDAGAVVLR